MPFPAIFCIIGGIPESRPPYGRDRFEISGPCNLANSNNTFDRKIFQVTTNRLPVGGRHGRTYATVGKRKDVFR